MPTARALFPKGNLQRRLPYRVFVTNGADSSTMTYGPDSLAFQPTDGVLYDSASKTYQFMSLGTYTISVVRAEPPLNSTVTVVDAPTITQPHP